MKIPEFKPSRRFLGDYDVPCLAAEVNNSQVGLSVERVVKYNDDRTFTVYLRGKNAAEISPWQLATLEQLFVHDAIPAALAEGIKELGDNYVSEIAEEDRLFFKQHGYSPYAYLYYLVIDEIKQRVMFLVKMDLNDEHLVTINLVRGRWRYEDHDYFLRYQSAFEKHWINTEAIQREEREKLWAAMFPPAKPDDPVTSDCHFIYGRWVAEKRETAKLAEQFKWNVSVLEDDTYTFSEGGVKHTSRLSKPLVGPIVAFERQGNWVTVSVGDADAAPKDRPVEPKSFVFWWSGTRLITEWGVIFQRAGLWEKYFPMTNTEVRAASGLNHLAGDWVFSEHKTAEVFKLLTNSEEDLELLKQENASSPQGYQFVEGRRNSIVGGEVRSYVKITGCERCGNHYFLRLVVPGKMILTPEVWCDGEFLVERSGVSYQRTISKSE